MRSFALPAMLVLATTPGCQQGDEAPSAATPSNRTSTLAPREKEPGKASPAPGGGSAEAQTGQGERWLVRVAQDAKASALQAIAFRLRKALPQARIVTAPDGAGFSLLAAPPASRKEAERALTRISSLAPGAALVRSSEQGPSLWEPSRVSATFFQMEPDEYLDDEALLTRPLARTGEHALDYVPYYEAEDDSPLLGVLAGAALVEGDGHRFLVKPCLQAKASVSPDGSKVAIECVHAQANDELLHRVQVFALRSAKPLGAHAPCRTPSWRADGRLTCQEEAVDADGQLSLEVHEVALTSAR